MSEEINHAWNYPNIHISNDEIWRIAIARPQRYNLTTDEWSLVYRGGETDATITVIEYGVVIGHECVAKDPQSVGSRRDKDRYAAARLFLHTKIKWEN